jgi:hypothetical protein
MLGLEEQISPARKHFAAGVALLVIASQVRAGTPAENLQSGLKARIAADCAFNANDIQFTSDTSVRLTASEHETWRSISCAMFHLQKAGVKITAVMPDGSPLFRDPPAQAGQ